MGDEAKQRAKAKEILAKADGNLKLVDSSFIFTSTKCREFPTFQLSELTPGSLLGKGGFSAVKEVDKIVLHDQVEAHPGDEGDSKVTKSGKEGRDDEHYEVSQARKIMSKQYLRFGSARYAIKKLKSDLSIVDRARGAVDLAIEIKFLSAIWHPNIIKMRGYSDTPRVDEDTFLVLDRLYATLEDKIEEWNRALAMFQGCCGLNTKNPEYGELLTERLLVAYDLSSAFNYLHGLRLLYRDIKPENIGFDVRGDVKVFDFGLCKSLERHNKNPDGYGYKLSAKTGSIPYMAPEIALGKPYDQKADVFSFVILLWEIMSTDWAFNGMDAKTYFIRVCAQNQRMPQPSSWPAIVRTVIEEGWKPEPEKRPTMKRVSTLLRGELEDLSTDSAVLNRTQHMMNKSRRSQRGLKMDTSRSRRSSAVFLGGDIVGLDNDDEIKAPNGNK